MSSENEKLTCPACGSERVSFATVGKSGGGEALRASVGKSSGAEAPDVTCDDCAHVWRAPTSI